MTTSIPFGPFPSQKHAKGWAGGFTKNPYFPFPRSENYEPKIPQEPYTNNEEDWFVEIEVASECVPDLLCDLARLYNVTAHDLALRAGLATDRLNNGGLPEVVKLLLDEEDDPVWVVSLITEYEHNNDLWPNG